MSEISAGAPNRAEYQLSDPHQVAIHRRLQLVGPEVADFFHDCCAIMAEATNLRSRTHLAAHLLREIDGRVRDVLEPLFGDEGRARIDEAGKEKQTHRTEITESGRVLRLDEQVIALWTEFALPLHEFAHRESLAGPRGIEEFERQWEIALIVLDAVTQRFETVYLDALPLLERLAAKNTPSKKDKTELRGRLPHSDVLLGEFFERAGLGWFDFLEEVGYFRNPRPLRPKPDGSIGYVQWPPGRFLVRAATEPRLRSTS